MRQYGVQWSWIEIMSKIHPTAIVNDECVIGENVQIGPYSIIKDKVKIGDGTIIHPFVHISGNTDIGKKNNLIEIDWKISLFYSEL